MSEQVRRLNLVIRGAVQGVGFRPFVYRLAMELGLRGQVRNAAEGVVIDAEGPAEQLDLFRVRIFREKPPRSSIQSLEGRFLDPIGYASFSIERSSGGTKTALILPDIATCDDCLADIRDPGNRRYGYPFTNCTNCGPRFSIIEGLPYDRPNTTMKRFRMCPDCLAEYRNPLDRRFHAQPNACPVCGPRLEMMSPAGEALARGAAALERAAEALLRGDVLAVKGLGGFHLMADAGNSDSVARLRERKHREEKPFALMCPDLAAVEAIAEVGQIERDLLGGPERPIVLLDRRSSGSARLSELVAPASPALGVMLPYTPLHHLLLERVARPLVATSGNLSEEPICTDNQEALERLGEIADSFLLHDRPIARHVDDSVARVVLGRPMLLRRARGYAPLPLSIGTDGETILAVGGHLKNTVALSVAGNVFVSQHIGDLETEPAQRAFRRVIGDFRAMYEAEPARVACDAHPDYASTRFAESLKIPAVPVQHHYAHALSCMAENELSPPVLGICWDGTGYGPDQTVWGGEFVLVGDGGYQRFAHFRTFPLPGGEAAVREPRRAALGLLYEALGETLWSELPEVLTAAFEPNELKALRRMLERSLNCPRTSSVGRLFDAAAALTGLRQTASFEGQAAAEFESRIAPGLTDDFYPFPVTPRPERQGRESNETLPGPGAPSEGIGAEPSYLIDWEPAVHRLLADGSGPAAIGAIVAKFHEGLGSAMVEVARLSRLERVVLSGGCFQNRRLLEAGVRRLRAEGFRVYWHQLVPPNDGGIALGQVMAAVREKR